MPDKPLSENHTRLSVIMFSDIVGYSKMMQENETLAMTLLNRHNEIIRNALAAHDGNEVKVIGDAFLVSFTTVANAVRCAVEIQEQFAKYNEQAIEKEKILLRIGIHMGDIIVKDNDVFGDGVNIASRIEPLAEPGGICISQEVYNLVRHKLDLQVVSLGPKELKNIKDKIEIYEILVGSITTKGHRSKKRRKNRKIWIYSAAAVIVLAFGILIIIQTWNKSSNPIITRTIKTGSDGSTDANISPDGNWIVYGDNPSRQNPNLYLIPFSGGQPKKITEDTTENWKISPCFSSDASQIAYESNNAIFTVPTLGGRSRRIISNGRLPMWSPNGKYIAFFRDISDNDGVSLFIADQDGSEEKVVTTFKPVNSFNAAWSPDSKRIAYLRNYQSNMNEWYAEIFVRELENTAEQQITFDKKRIDDFCWSSTGEIIFNSNRSGDMDLWAVQEQGGKPTQITLGPGDDGMPRISKDAQRLVYMNNYQSINLWTINLQATQLQQLTFEDAQFGSTSYSWDGKKLIYFQRNGLEPTEDGIVICNSDGSEPVRILSKIDQYSLDQHMGLRWSADMKLVYFTGVRNDTMNMNPVTTAVKYSFFVYDLDASITRKISDGAILDVSGDGKYLLYAPDPAIQDAVLALVSSPQTKIVMGKTAKLNMFSRFSKDSKSIITPDSSGIWITRLDAGKKVSFIKTQKDFNFVEPMPDGKAILGTMRNPGMRTTELVKINISDGRLEHIGKLPPRSLMVGGFYNGSVSPDGKTLVFSIYEGKNRIMVLDNFR